MPRRGSYSHPAFGPGRWAGYVCDLPHEVDRAGGRGRIAHSGRNRRSFHAAGLLLPLVCSAWRLLLPIGVLRTAGGSALSKSSKTSRSPWSFWPRSARPACRSTRHWPESSKAGWRIGAGWRVSQLSIRFDGRPVARGCFAAARPAAGSFDDDDFGLRLVQAEQLGTGIAQVIRRQADDLRKRRRERANAFAASLAVKRMFPLVLCFLPGLFVWTLGPVFTQLFIMADR